MRFPRKSTRNLSKSPKENEQEAKKSNDKVWKVETEADSEKETRNKKKNLYDMKWNT